MFKKHSRYIALFICLSLLLTACGGGSGGERPQSDKILASDSELFKYFFNPEGDELDEIEEFKETFDYLELAGYATDFLYIIPLQDDVEFRVEMIFHPYELRKELDYELLGTFTGDKGEGYGLDLGLSSPHSSIRIIAEREGKIAAKEFIRSDTGDSFQGIATAGDTKPFEDRYETRIFSGNAALAVFESGDDSVNTLVEAAWDSVDYWWVIVRTLFQLDALLPAEVTIVSAETYDYLVSVMFNDAEAPEPMSGIEIDESGDLHLAPYYDDFFNYYWYYAATAAKPNSADGYVFTEILLDHDDDVVFQQPLYRVDWKAKKERDLYSTIEYELDTVNLMKPLELDEYESEVFLEEYFRPLRWLGLDDTRWSNPEELSDSIEEILDAYEFFEFNSSFDYEDSMELDGEIIIVSEKEIEDYVFAAVGVPAEALRKSYRYDELQGGYEMEVMDGLGDYFEVALLGAWEYEDTILFYVEYWEDEFDRHWFVANNNRRRGNWLYMGGN